MIALPVQIAVPAPAPALAPVLGRPYRLDIVQQRDDGGVARRFGTHYTLLFRRDARGLVAELTLVTLDETAGGAIGRRFLAGAGALRDRTMTVHLLPDGTIDAIEDEDALWSATLAAVAGMAPSGGSTQGLAATPAGPLRALSPAARRAYLASPLLAVLAGDVAPGGPRPALLPARPPLPADPAPATQTVTRRDDGMIEDVVTRTVDAATLDRRRVIDPAHGLALGSTEIRSIGRDAAVLTLRTTTTLTPPVS